MAPQPLSKVNSTTPVLFHPKALTERPELAILVSRAIAGWAEIEGQMSYLLIKLLGANAVPGLAMYSALTSAPAQIATVRAAAQSILDPERMEIVSAVLSIASSQASKRHHLAHRIWGYAAALPNALILADGKDLAAYWMSVFEAARIFASGQQPPEFDYPRDRIFVYRKRDLEEIIGEMDDLKECFYNLGFIVEPGDHWRDSTLQWLRSNPRIRQALSRTQKAQQSP